MMLVNSKFYKKVVTWPKPSHVCYFLNVEFDVVQVIYFIYSFRSFCHPLPKKRHPVFLNVKMLFFFVFLSKSCLQYESIQNPVETIKMNEGVVMEVKIKNECYQKF